MYEHMKRPMVSRLVTPGAPDSLDSDELQHFRDLPAPKRRRGAARSENRAMQAGEAVLAYWARDSKSAQESPQPSRQQKRHGD